MCCTLKLVRIWLPKQAWATAPSYLGRDSNNPNIFFLVYNIHSLQTVGITKDMKIMPRVFFFF